VAPLEYANLHNELIGACRSLAASSDGQTRAFYQSLEDLARPWMSPGVFARADRELLFGLLIRCRQVERGLCGRARVAFAWWRLTPLVGATTVGAAAALLACASARRWSPALDEVRSWAALARFALKNTSSAHQWLVISLVVAGASAYLVSRAARG
jgi:hypothetical protein